MKGQGYYRYSFSFRFIFVSYFFFRSNTNDFEKIKLEDKRENSRKNMVAFRLMG